ncbi:MULTISPECIES: indolepyruvate ferredoxin oxidoreductase family protein [unclassified Polaromonas]|uniref:indolepyruvate ferredoxin oxidoreductase family protein n=1 Tax=unclassified Polaromonas TaxID=2638319 RepID=UPI0018C9201C|nr:MULTISPECIES: indolepyruvate ferredoxin oxidoreductase family protein [unclassified Polaromonas]MBG6073918.1 indolepyruvate ferredoxin oxidoreductase [Polaromonas sp. CG_9.7]MBG6115903.1 indolepyruvate ferredoxin oxidoreductase [Polaromonas sp. CG_9.2]MDH6183328.1 indolepyruvate ferredoxin oxidoreductase [Polaromonas sp. CG_23.6]
MNAPLPEHIRKALETVTLDDKYSIGHGRAFMSGVQALVRLPMLQRTRDAIDGLNTGGFISGYRGSPLGGYDQALWAAKKHLAAQNIVFQPGVNEELGATAVWGTQQLDLYPQSKKFDGVFGIWYGKGPGVDRCSDVFKHANMAGTAKHGGVIAIAGDDHISKSSTAPHQSDHIFKACGLPVFFPSSVQEILDMGLHAFAMSRFSGVWSGMKTIQEVVESSSSVSVDPDRVKIIIPEDFQMPPGGLHIRWPDAPLEQEARLMDYKWYAALAYVRANKLNYNVISGPNDRFGLIASGKAFNDTRQALSDLGLDEDTCHQLGIRLHKVNVVWPLEATITRDFAQGLQEILVVEEKRQVIEYQIKEELYNWRADVRPNVLGKFDEPEGDQSGGEWGRANPSDNWLLRAKADLTPAIIAKAIAKRLKKLGVSADIVARMDSRLAVIDARERALIETKLDTGERAPWFCSGCPHNTSTRVPEGSRAVAGIGCHYMATWMDRSTSTFTQMGGEGVSWIGQAPFTTDAHVFANLGDGTYFHSGLLAIRQSIAAGVNITYKILYNDAVAMTGGQQVGERPEGHSVAQIAHSLRAEGVVKLIVVTDEPEKYHGRTHTQDTSAARASHTELLNDLPPGVEVFHRDELDKLQREFRELKGCTAIIYDQTCATEKRRRRKRGTLVDPAKRVVINELVCEGCGDCSVQSNCLSVEPLETEFGRKRRINQNTCNKDYSCVKGFCPSFVTVEGGQLKKPKKEKKGDLSSLSPIPEPVLPVAEKAWGIVVGGVGGTGVITIGQLLGMAAHLEGKGVVTQDAGGLAQKGGATWSHIQIANRPESIYTTKVDTAKADLVIGCDPIVTASPYTLATMQPGRTFVAMNSHGAPTAAFVTNPGWQFPGGNCESAVQAAVGAEGLASFDAEQVAVQLIGDSIYTNPLILGFAWQKGRVPLSHAALMRAIELNAVQVDNNKAAFEWGRRCAHDLASVQAMFKAAQVIEFVKKPSQTEMLTKRVAFLTAYQNAAYAQTYQAFVEKVRAIEAPLGKTTLTEAVTRYLFKLMAYKDEYEVARLHTDSGFLNKVNAMFEGDFKLNYHLAPPLLAKQNDKGELQKQQFGPWMLTGFKLLAKLKGVRGTPFDVFGRSEERKEERALIAEYRASVEEILASLSLENHATAVEIARIPELIKGYGHVKARHLAAARPQWEALMQAFRQPERVREAVAA